MGVHQTESKDEIFEKIKSAVLEKRSIFLYRKDSHELRQSRGVDPERFAARIKQLALACRFNTEDDSLKYGQDIMSTIFNLRLEDT